MTRWPEPGAACYERGDQGGAMEESKGSALEVLRIFLRLGCSCFGGPVAHIGYFRTEFVSKRGWLAERDYAELVGLCQFLPGPASSQVGFAIGLLRAGLPGALAAWVGFTLPSALLLVAFAYGAGHLNGGLGQGLLHGLKLVAVAIVAQAVWGMAKSFCPDLRRAGIAVACGLLILSAQSGAMQLVVIALGALAGLALCQGGGVPEPVAQMPVSRRAGLVALGLFFLLLFGLPMLAWMPSMAVMAAFYHAGALVFGGGHVVLPLLRDAVVAPGWVGSGAFLAGYGAAQAVPGPLFSFAAYLGTLAAPLPGPGGAALALIGIFLPGMLILLAALPFWAALRRRPGAQAAMRGVNAAVVGLLAASLYNPVWTSAVLRPADAALALVLFLLLLVAKLPPLAVVGLGALGGMGLIFI
ncbi:chromate efflux transporter [Acidocella facilis]